MIVSKIILMEKRLNADGEIRIEGRRSECVIDQMQTDINAA